MENQIKEFIKYLKQENEAMDKLAEMGNEKTHLILKNKIEELNQLILDEAGIIKDLQQLEDRRYALHQELAVSWEQDMEDLAAKQVLIRVKKETPELYDEFRVQIDHLDYNLTRLKAINSHNNELLEQSLDFLAYMEKLLYGDKAGVYSDNGDYTDTKSNKPNKHLLDKKI